jgi:hypothetical protein
VLPYPGLRGADVEAFLGISTGEGPIDGGTAYGRKGFGPSREVDIFAVVCWESDLLLSVTEVLDESNDEIDGCSQPLGATGVSFFPPVIASFGLNCYSASNIFCSKYHQLED